MLVTKPAAHCMSRAHGLNGPKPTGGRQHFTHPGNRLIDRHNVRNLGLHFTLIDKQLLLLLIFLIDLLLIWISCSAPLEFVILHGLCFDSGAFVIFSSRVYLHFINFALKALLERAFKQLVRGHFVVFELQNSLQTSVYLRWGQLAY